MKFFKEKKNNTVKNTGRVQKYQYRKARKHMTSPIQIQYDSTLGVIRMIDTSIDANSTVSVSPITLSPSLKESIKKPVMANNG